MSNVIHFVMPQDGLEPSLVDELFRPQADALRLRGYGVSLVADTVFSEGARLRAIPAGATVVYRGWMVRPHKYEWFCEAVRDARAIPLTDSNTYTLTHHLPNWCPLLSEFTAETVTVSSVDDLQPTLTRLNWGSYFLSDFVKSLKVDGGSIVRSSVDADRWLHEMLHYRDELEGGVCIRRVEDFVPDTECRFFVIFGVPRAPDDRPIPSPVIAAAKRIAGSFFTVDVAQNTVGDWRIVELGDGQVSDLVGWTSEQFADAWKK